MELIHKFINIIAPPLAITSLFFFPSYFLFNFVTSTLNSIFNHQDHVAGKVVLITGASSGIGEHLAYEYARRGACLALAARRKNSLREVAARALRLGSPDAITVPTDVSKLDDCRRLIDQAIDHFGRRTLPEEAASKKILDLSGLKKYVYPDSILTPFISSLRSGDSVQEQREKILLAPPANNLWPCFLV